MSEVSTTEQESDRIIGNVEDLLGAGAVDAALCAWRLKPSAPMIATLSKLAAKLIELGRWSDAKFVARNILERDPKQAQAILMLAWALVHLDRPATALELLANLDLLNPADAKKRDAIQRIAEKKKKEVPYEIC